MSGTVVVTGARGFIGRHLVSWLARRQHRVVAIDTVPAPASGARGVDHIVADVRSVTSRVFTGADAIVHLAALKSVPDSFTCRANYPTNVAVDAHVVREFGISSAPRLIVAGSCEVYGAATTGRIAEAAPFAPRSPYAVGKVSTELLMRSLAPLDRTREFCTARLFNTYGPDEAPDAVVPRLIDEARRDGQCTIEGDGHQRRDLAYVDDTVETIGRLVQLAGRLPTAVNVGTGVSTSVRDVARHIMASAGATELRWVDARPNEIAEFRADTSLCDQLVGRRRSIDVKTGIARCVSLRPWPADDRLLTVAQ
jgi:nucleoside-diphosphate-sugar epimerase